MNRSTMRRHRYAPVDLPREPSRGERASARAADVRQVAKSTARLARVASLGLRRTLPPADEMQRAVLSVNPEAWGHYPDFDVPRVPEPPPVE